MKLRNKKTGKIINSDELLTDKFILDLFSRDFDYFNSKLHKIDDEWEEYEEPKPWWYIDITLVVKQGELFLSNHVEQFKTVGNYFETREEAEKAVEKLKAWKRLKDDYHIRFNLDFVKNTISFTYRIDGTLHSVIDDEPIVFEDMKTIFGGEE